MKCIKEKSQIPMENIQMNINSGHSILPFSPVSEIPENASVRVQNNRKVFVQNKKTFNSEEESTLQSMLIRNKITKLY